MFIPVVGAEAIIEFSNSEHLVFERAARGAGRALDQASFLVRLGVKAAVYGSLIVAARSLPFFSYPACSFANLSAIHILSNV